ncbi:MAG TPA: hypothetical protein VLA44_08460 [Clostridia bacterium]|nr:hypothetical protein [Clostridia bacterium]
MADLIGLTDMWRAARQNRTPVRYNPVDNRGKPGTERWTSHCPIVDNRPASVDEHARTVDGRAHNMLWSRFDLDRYILWFWP